MAKRVPADERFKISPQLRQDIHDRFVAGLGDPASPASQLLRLLAAQLLEDVLRERAAKAAAQRGRPRSDGAERPIKRIPLADWAALHYDPPPSVWTLRQWVRAAQIVPAPEKVGKGYYVSPDAKRITDSTPTGAMARFLESCGPQG